MRKGKRHKTYRRNPQAGAHSIIVRYDYDTRRWVHSAGIVVTPREVIVLEGLARGHSVSDIIKGSGMSSDTYHAAQARLKRYFGIKPRCIKGHQELIKIAMDLYGVRAETPCREG